MVACGSAAQAGVYADDLTKCLVKSANADDKMAFVQWMFSAMASHPAVQQYAKINDEQRANLNKKAGALIQRLMTVDCRTEMVAALKNEGGSSIEIGFKTLGEVAMRGLFSDSNVAKSMSDLQTGVDTNEMKKLFSEAGITTAASATK